LQDSTVVGIILIFVGIIVAIFNCYASGILVLIGLFMILRSSSKSTKSQYNPPSGTSYPRGHPSYQTQPHRYPPHHPSYHKQVQQEYVDNLRYKQAAAKYKSQKKRICPHCDEYSAFKGNLCTNCGQDYRNLPDL
jgi:hypothetical protein